MYVDIDSYHTKKKKLFYVEKKEFLRVFLETNIIN
jgi:hypothetical protein